MINKSVTIDIEQYKAAIGFISINNPSFAGRECDIRETLDDLIKKAFTSGNTTGTIGLYVACFDYSEDKTKAFCEILVDPAVGKEHYFIDMAI